MTLNHRGMTIVALHSLIQNRLNQYFSHAYCVLCTVLHAGARVCKTDTMLAFLECAF